MMYSRTTSIHSSRRKRTRLTTSRLRRSRLLTEVAMRKLNLDPEKTEQMELISDQLSEDDIHFFTHIFSQIDSASLEQSCSLSVSCCCTSPDAHSRPCGCDRYCVPADQLGIILRSELHEVRKAAVDLSD